VEVHCDDAVAIISGGHTNFVYEAKGGEVVLDRRTQEVGKKDNGAEKDIELNMRLVYDFAMTAPLSEIEFIKQTKEYNMNAAHEAILGNYGHNLGKTIDRPLAQGIFANYTA
ncbi:serine dehydratase subunit alpha family protein, partial [Parabacteroides distasonis]